MRRLLAISFLLAQPAGWKPPAVRIQDEGAVQGYASTLNCVGAGISCSVGASVATVTVTGGGGGSATPGGSSGNVQINSSGVFGAYTGTSCTYAVKSLDANGAATCTAAPTIPAPGGSAAELQIRATATTFGAYAGTSCAYAVKTLGVDGVATCTAAPTIPADVSGKKYLIQTADAALPNAQAMGALATGLVLNTTATGVQSAYGGTSCTNQFPRSLNASGAATCAGVALADFVANLGTTTTVLHGNAAGQPTYGAVALGTDVSGTLAVGNGGLGAAVTPAAGTIVYGSSATAHAELAAGTAGQVLISGGAGAPSWGNGCVTLGTANGATTTVGPVIWTGTYNNLIIEYEITGYNGGTPVGRILVGGASISTTALTNGSSASEGIAGTLTNMLSIPGAPLAVTLSSIGRSGTMNIRGRSGAIKRYEIIGQNGNASVSVASTLFRSVGNFSDLGTNLPLQRAQLTVYDTLVATAASSQTFTSGTTITVIGCP